MKNKLIKLASVILFCTVSLHASMLESGRSVVVLPLLFSYQVKQDFQRQNLLLKVMQKKKLLILIMKITEMDTIHLVLEHQLIVVLMENMI